MFKSVIQSLKYSVNSFIKTKGFGWNTRMLVLSANKIGTDISFMILGKSFINRRKSKGQCPCTNK